MLGIAWPWRPGPYQAFKLVGVMSCMRGSLSGQIGQEGKVNRCLSGSIYAGRFIWVLR